MRISDWSSDVCSSDLRDDDFGADDTSIFQANAFRFSALNQNLADGSVEMDFSAGCFDAVRQSIGKGLKAADRFAGAQAVQHGDDHVSGCIDRKSTRLNSRH